MSPTPEFVPDKAIIPITDDYSIADPVMYIMATLRREWDPSRTDGTRPVVDLSEVMKNFIFQSGDYLILYSTSTSSKPVTLTYGWTNEIHNFSLDFFTAKDRKHLDLFVEEARRILHAHRKDTIPLGSNVSGRMWLEWGIRSTPFERTMKGMYRRTIDCSIQWRFRSA